MAKLNGDSDKDFGISTMLNCKAAEVFNELAGVQPSIANVDTWDYEKTKKLNEAKPTFDKYIEEFNKLCSEDGKFTKLGKTTGELSVFSLLYHMKVVGFKPEFPAKLTAFYKRIEALEGVQKCITGKSKMGDMANYLVPVP